jgi:hypothetical protein
VEFFILKIPGHILAVKQNVILKYVNLQMEKTQLLTLIMVTITKTTRKETKWHVKVSVVLQTTLLRQN